MYKNKKVRTKKVYEKSAVPIYAAAVLWVACAYTSDMHTLSGIFATALLSYLVYCVFSLFFKGPLVEINRDAGNGPSVNPPSAHTKASAPVSEADTMVAEGRKTLAEIRKANNNIPNAALSNKILEIEQTATKILYHISQNPQKAPQIRKFLSYYLPTTLKLVQEYEKLWQQNVEGENINSAMRDIENIMNKIERAFDNQLDSLFKDVALDVSTDIAVLDNMLTMEGLLDDQK